MQDTFSVWLNRFMFATEIIFLAASMPHIAAWFAHFDNPTDAWSTAYAYGIGFALAFAIDGVSFVLLLAITRMFKQEKTNGFVIFGLLVFMTFIALLSAWINWQYDVAFSSDMFVKADSIGMLNTTVGALNPIVGGSFQILILAYALIGKAVKNDVQPLMSDAEYEQERIRLMRKQELAALKRGSGGLLASGKQALLGTSQSDEEKRATLLNNVVDYLRNAIELLDSGNQELACEAISSYLKISSKDALPYLLAARTTIAKEEQARDTDKLKAISVANDEPVKPVANADPLAGLNGRDTVSIEQAATMLNCSEKHVVTLRNAGKLKHASKNDRLITVASIRQYATNRRSTGRSTTDETNINTDSMPSVNTVHSNDNGHAHEPMNLDEYVPFQP